MIEVAELKDMLEKILAGLTADGTHPDFPVRRIFKKEEWAGHTGSGFILDLPALVIYEPHRGGGELQAGIIFALRNCLEGGGAQVISKHNGGVVCHLIEESPLGAAPAYLLTKEHSPMITVP
jgi:hypothetical protein